MSTSSIGWNVVSFLVPANARPGTTRMRVSMRNLMAPLPCGTFDAGETEDYGFVILPSAINQAIPISDFGQNVSIEKLVTIVPNPANNLVYIHHDFDKLKPIFISVYNASGQLLISKQLVNNLLDVNKLTNGWYIVKIRQDNNFKSSKLLIQH